MKLLIADDDRNLRTVLAAELADEGFEIALAESGAAALDMLGDGAVEVMLLDLNMPGPGGMEVLKSVRSSELPVEVIILTAHASIPTAVEAMRFGAYDYLTKPFRIEELKEVVLKAAEKRRLLRENLALKHQLNRQAAVSGRMVAESAAMREVMEQVAAVARSEFPLLILGESGAGKELVARAVHAASSRAGGPFLAVNCGAIPETMMESELFGYERGAFTGAHTRKAGLLEIAEGGTILFDEIGELPLPLQVKLLRVVETKRFMRLGGVKETSVDVRFFSATNRDLAEAVRKGAFRQDLYYRISPLVLSVPPLRERREDLPALVEHFAGSDPAFRGKRFTAAALGAFADYPWPGNVRELQNVIHRVLLLSKGDLIDRDDLPADLTAALPAGRERPRRLEEAEKTHILAVLKEAGGHRGKAAEALGIDPKTLYRKLLHYGIRGAR